MDKKGIYILEIFKKKGPFSIILEQLSSVLKAFEIKSIKKKMILVFLILALIPLLAMRLVVYPKAQDALQDIFNTKSAKCRTQASGAR